MDPASTRPQLCIGCVHYTFDKGMADSLADPCRCTHPAVRDALGTESVPASWARGDRKPEGRKRCGPRGDLFEPVPPRDPIWVSLLAGAIIFATAAVIIGVWP